MFADVREYKKELLKSKEQVARQVLSMLIIFATGGEIEFADRNEIEQILLATTEDGYPLRGFIHQLVAIHLFKNR